MPPRPVPGRSASGRRRAAPAPSKSRRRTARACRASHHPSGTIRKVTPCFSAGLAAGFGCQPEGAEVPGELANRRGAWDGEEKSETEILARVTERGRRRNAPLQARHREKRTRRQAQGEKPQAGDRDRTFQGAQEGQEGAAQAPLKRRTSARPGFTEPWPGACVCYRTQR